jgi:hypothetical protein
MLALVEGELSASHSGSFTPGERVPYTQGLTLLILTYSVDLVRKRTTPTEQPPLVGELVPTSADRGCRVVSVTDPYGRILGFLDRKIIDALLLLLLSVY